MGKFATVLVAAILWLTSIDASRAEPAVLLDGQAEIADSGGGGVTLTLGLTRPVPWRLWMADGPPRVIVELTDSRHSAFWGEGPEDQQFDGNEQ